MEPAAVIFDVDGVLLDLTPAEEDAFFHPFKRLHALTGLSRDWDSYRIRNDHDIITEILERHLGRSPRDTEIAEVTEVYLAHLRSSIASATLAPVEIAGARKLLSKLNGQNLSIGIATANLREAAEIRLRAAGLWRFVAALPFGADDGGAKSAILARAIDATGLPKQRIVYIGDNVNDVEAGLRNEIHFIGFARDAARREKLTNAGALEVCGDHHTTYQLICRMLGWTSQPTLENIG